VPKPVEVFRDDFLIQIGPDAEQTLYVGIVAGQRNVITCTFPEVVLFHLLTVHDDGQGVDWGSLRAVMT
jgi:hypothetical protein